MTRMPWLRRTGALLLLLAAALAAVAIPALSGPPDEPETDPLPEGTLEALAELSGRAEFYLVVDPHRFDMRLMYRGAELRRFPILTVERALRRRAFSGAADQAGPWLTPLQGGTLRPSRDVRRVAIDPPAPGAELPEPTMPPTPEEAYPAPGRFFVRFPSGDALELVAGTGEPPALLARALSWPTRRLGSFFAAVRPGADRARLTLTLAADEAGALYRALPPSVGLVVLDAAMSAALAPRPPAPRAQAPTAGSD